MRVLPIWDMFTKIGEICLAQNGLYYEYTAQIATDRSGFVRLYAHQKEESICLGVFAPDGTTYTCKGRISVRDFGQADSCRFSIQLMCMLAQCTPLDGGLLPPNALYIQEKGRRLVMIAHEDSLPDEILPYFCFLRPEQIDGISCLVFDADSCGRPVIPG